MSAETIQGEPLKLGEVEEVPSEIDARLRVVASGKGRVYSITGNTMVIGRDDGCDVVVDDPRVSVVTPSSRTAAVSFG